MGDRCRQLDMCHALASNLGLDDFNAALFTNDTPVLHTLVFTAIALIIFRRAENLGTKQPVPFGLECAVIDGFRLFDLTVRPFTNLFRRSQRNSNTKILSWISRFGKKIVKSFHCEFLYFFG